MTWSVTSGARQDRWPDFEKGWRRALHDGLISGTAFCHANQVSLARSNLSPLATAPKRLELTFRADPTIWDGRFANNGWLQELPKPITKLTWDNAALISPAMAQKQALANGDMVDLESAGRKLRLPVWIIPGQAADTVDGASRLRPRSGGAGGPGHRIQRVSRCGPRMALGGARRAADENRRAISIGDHANASRH